MFATFQKGLVAWHLTIYKMASIILKLLQVSLNTKQNTHCAALLFFILSCYGTCELHHISFVIITPMTNETTYLFPAYKDTVQRKRQNIHNGKNECVCVLYCVLSKGLLLFIMQQLISMSFFNNKNEKLRMSYNCIPTYVHLQPSCHPPYTWFHLKDATFAWWLGYPQHSLFSFTYCLLHDFNSKQADIVLCRLKFDTEKRKNLPSTETSLSYSLFTRWEFS